MENSLWWYFYFCYLLYPRWFSSTCAAVTHHSLRLTLFYLLLILIVFSFWSVVSSHFNLHHQDRKMAIRKSLTDWYLQTWQEYKIVCQGLIASSRTVMKEKQEEERKKKQGVRPSPRNCGMAIICHSWRKWIFTEGTMCGCAATRMRGHTRDKMIICLATPPTSPFPFPLFLSYGLASAPWDALRSPHS